jgi:hypothetical protein
MYTVHVWVNLLNLVRTTDHSGRAQPAPGRPRANVAFGAERTFIALAPLDTLVIGLSVGSRRMIEECSRCKAARDVDLAALPHAATTFVHDLASRLRCRKCARAGRRPSAMLLQLAQRARQLPET